MRVSSDLSDAAVIALAALTQLKQPSSPSTVPAKFVPQVICVLRIEKNQYSDGSGDFKAPKGWHVEALVDYGKERVPRFPISAISIKYCTWMHLLCSHKALILVLRRASLCYSIGFSDHWYWESDCAVLSQFYTEVSALETEISTFRKTMGRHS